MKFGASLRNRQVIAKLDKGEDFIETLKAFFLRERARSCVFTGNGFFSKCRLQTLDPDLHSMQTIFASDSFVTVPQIIGNITFMGTEVIVNASCMLVYRMFNQLHTVGGLIQDARVYSAELHLTICDDLRLMRSLDPITGLVPISKIQSAYDEDYASGIRLNNESSIGLSSDFTGNNNDYADLSLSSSLPGSAHASNPEIVHRKRTRSTSAESSGSSSVLALENPPTLDFENLDTGIPGIKHRRKNASPSSSNFTGSDSKSSKQITEKTALPQDELGNASLPIKRKSSTISQAPTHDLCVGDWLIHPTMGKCTVQSILPNNCLQIHTEVGSDHNISMSYFRAVPIDDINGVRCFKLERL